MWLSQTHEDRQRAANHQPAATLRPEEAFGLKFFFPKEARLLKREEFRRVQREGTRVGGLCLTFCVLREEKGVRCAKLGITVSKKFGTAVQRNLFKRRIREAFRQIHHELPAGLQIHVSPKTNTVPPFAQIQEDFTLLINHVKSRPTESSSYH